MAVIKPFYGMRPVKEKAGRIAALPYDVYDTEEAKKEVEREPLSFLKIDRAETQFSEPVLTDDPRVYQKAHDILWQMAADGDFLTEKKKCYYIYELTMGERVQTGLAALAHVDDYRNGVIKKHENTRAEKEADRIRHVDACNAQTGPVFLAYRSRDSISRIVERRKKEKPLYDFVSPDGVRHRIFIIDGDTEIEQIKEAFADIREIYIADGHHRAASAVKVGLMRREQNPGYTGEEEFNYFLSVLFPEDQLKIMDYNRVVRDLNGYSSAEFLRKMNEIFFVENNDEDEKRPGRKGQFSMYLDGQWYRFRVREEVKSRNPVQNLDVSVLQDKLLGPVLNITDPRTDDRIDFVGGIRGIKELEHRASSDCRAAFALYPTSIQELFTVADAGLLMPPKSTWFEPKLRSGILIHKI